MLVIVFGFISEKSLHVRPLQHFTAHLLLLSPHKPLLPETFLFHHLLYSTLDATWHILDSQTANVIILTDVTIR